MRRRLDLLLGPTGVGKTARSVELAVRHRSPVIVLDRIQCHPELAVGSGRPVAAQLCDSTRVYLTERPLSAGVIDHIDAVDQLVSNMKSLWDSGADRLILEGGSISVLWELTMRTDWATGSTVSVEFLLEKKPNRYEKRIARRVEQMLGYGYQDNTILDEIRALWPDRRVRTDLKTIVGYREIIYTCLTEGLNPVTLVGRTADAWRYHFYNSVHRAHIEYSREQRREMAKIAEALAGLDFPVDVCLL